MQGIAVHFLYFLHKCAQTQSQLLVEDFVESKNLKTPNARKINKKYFAFALNTKGEHTNKTNFKNKTSDDINTHRLQKTDKTRIIEDKCVDETIEVKGKDKTNNAKMLLQNKTRSSRECIVKKNEAEINGYVQN